MSEIIIFSLSSRYRDCNCPCHRGVKGFFHCWSDCCDFPNALPTDIKESIRLALQATLDNPTN